MISSRPTDGRPTRRLLSAIACGLILSSVTGCATASGPSSSTYCTLYQPVYTTDAEYEALRPETQLTIDGNNAVWLDQGCDPTWEG